MTTSANFWNKISNKYAAMPIKDMPAYEQTLDRVRSHLSPQDHVLELGCGTGGTALILAKHAARITATDYAENMIEIGRNKASAQGITNVDFEVATLGGDVPVQGQYDVVMAMNLLHLVPNLPHAISEIRALLKPGGVFISKSGCLADTRPLVKLYAMRMMINAMQMIGKAPYVNIFTAAELESQITAEGFEIIETCTFSGAVPSQFFVARNL